MEYWSDGVLVALLKPSITPLLHYSSTPMDDYANHSAEDNITIE